MDRALNEVLGSLPDDTKVYVCRSIPLAGSNGDSPGMSTPKTTPGSLCLFTKTRQSKTSSTLPRTTEKPKGSSPLEMKRSVLAIDFTESDMDRNTTFLCGSRYARAMLAQCSTVFS
jgi:hypothetical protein